MPCRFTYLCAGETELVALEVADLTETPDGLHVLVRRSKTDQAGQGQTVAILRGRRLRPVEAVQAWLSASGITEGPIFRQVNKSRRLLPGALKAETVATVVKEAAGRAGFDPDSSPGTAYAEAS